MMMIKMMIKLMVRITREWRKDEADLKKMREPIEAAINAVLSEKP